MKHPNLVYMACAKTRITIPRLIYESFVYQERMTSTRRLYNLHQLFIHGCYDDVPQFIEDYALNLLAKGGHYELPQGNPKTTEAR